MSQPQPDIATQTSPDAAEAAADVADQLQSVSLASEPAAAPEEPEKPSPDSDSVIETAQIDAEPQSAASEQPPLPTQTKAKPKKAVGFASQDDLRQLHQEQEKKARAAAASNSFQRIPPELAYLQKKGEGPKPIGSKPPPVRKSSGKILGDLKTLHVKDISVQNKQTELNFNFPTFYLPIPATALIVDVAYAAVNSFDLSKINRYFYNLSDSKIGLGHAFAGTIVDIGRSCDSTFAKGDLVFGCVSPAGRKGSLSSSLILYPNKDFLVKIDELTLAKLEAIDENLVLEPKQDFGLDSDAESVPEAVAEAPEPKPRAKSAFPVEDRLPALAKTTVFPVLYCKAKQALSHTKFGDKIANVLINGADTSTGLAILQVLNSSLYDHLEELNVILVCRESQLSDMHRLIEHFTKGPYYNPTCTKNFRAVSFDLQNEDIVLPGEKVPVNFKKPELLAMEILDAMFAQVESITDANINRYKLDLIVDIVGSKRCLQKTSIKWDRLAMLAFPVQQKMADSVTLKNLVKANVKEQFLVKILKPKSQGSGFVSLCNFNLKEPSYSIDELIDYNTQTNEGSYFNPWSMGWSSRVANSMLAYNFYEEIHLSVKREWLIEGLNLFLKDQLKFRIDAYEDWRANYRAHIKRLRKIDGSVVFKIEEF